MNKTNLRKNIRVLEFPIVFLAMICSVGAFGGLLFRFQFTMTYFVVMVALAFASGYSCKRFYEIIKIMEGWNKNQFPVAN